MMTSTDRRAIVQGDRPSGNVFAGDFGGNPPGGGGMDARVSRLEEQHVAIMMALTRIETRLDAIDDKLAMTNQRIDETNKRIDRTNTRIDAMPDRYWTGRLMIMIIFATFALLLTASKILEITRSGL